MNTYTISFVYGESSIAIPEVQGTSPLVALSELMRSKASKLAPQLLELGREDGRETLLINPLLASAIQITLTDGEPVEQPNTGQSNIVIPIAGVDPRVEAEVRKTAGN